MTHTQTQSIQVENATRKVILVSAGEVADNSWTRFRGLLGRDSLEAGQGLLIVPCNSIHMFFMRLCSKTGYGYHTFFGRF